MLYMGVQQTLYSIPLVYPLKMRTTTLKVTLRTRERLLKHQKYGHSYDQTINRLLDILEMEECLELPGEEPKIETPQST